MFAGIATEIRPRWHTICSDKIVPVSFLKMFVKKTLSKAMTRAKFVTAPPTAYELTSIATEAAFLGI